MKITNEIFKTRLKELINAIEIGEKSGFVKNFDTKKNLKRIHLKFLSKAKNAK